MVEPQNELIGALLDIHFELRNTPIRPKVVGGLAIYLRARDVFEREQQTLLPRLLDGRTWCCEDSIQGPSWALTGPFAV